MTADPVVMRHGAGAGARLIIDRSAEIDSEMVYRLADIGLPVMLRRVLRSLRHPPGPFGPLAGLHADLEEQIEIFEGAGVRRDRLIVEPVSGPDAGFGGGEGPASKLGAFHDLGCALYFDVSAAGANQQTAFDPFAGALIDGVQLIGCDEPAEASRRILGFAAATGLAMVDPD
jgi:dihydropteroate synthase